MLNDVTRVIIESVILLYLFDSAAEAVMKGQTDSILLFHQQNVPRTKLEQVRQI